MKCWAILPHVSYKISGDDAKLFLQGQLTQDINIINEHQAHYAAYCNPKGRMLGLFLIYQRNHELYLRVNDDIADSVVKRLTLFILRSKVTLTKSESTAIGMTTYYAQLFADKYQFELPEAIFSSVGGEGFTLIKMPGNGRYECYTTQDKKSEMTTLFSDKENNSHYRHIALQSGDFNIHPETSETILPQTTPLESWGVINYQKGCYVGQEIIARNKYLGKVKKALAYAEIGNNSPITLSSDIYLDQRPVGRVIESNSSDSNTIISAILPIEHINKPLTINETLLQFKTPET